MFPFENSARSSFVHPNPKHRSSFCRNDNTIHEQI